MMNVRATDADQLLDQLRRMFPAFESHSRDGDEDVPSLHSVMAAFLIWFGINARRQEEVALKQFASFLDQAVAVDDVLENAMTTCFLEHLRQVNSYKILAPHLSKEPRTKTKA
jgi:hypothetical protein